MTRLPPPTHIQTRLRLLLAQVGGALSRVDGSLLVDDISHLDATEKSNNGLELCCDRTASGDVGGGGAVSDDGTKL